MTISSILKKFSLVAAGTVALTIGVSEAAYAVFIDFRSNTPREFFDPNAGQFFSITEPVSGITVTATGRVGLNSSDATAVVNRDLYGLGIGGSSERRAAINGRGGSNSALDEILSLSFNKSVKITEVVFSPLRSPGDGDEASFRLDRLNSQVLIDQLITPVANNRDTSTFSFSGTALADIFATQLEIGARDGNDGFFVAGIDVEPVPEPLTILGSLSALGVGMVLKKKQKKA